MKRRFFKVSTWLGLLISALAAGQVALAAHAYLPGATRASRELASAGRPGARALQETAEPTETPTETPEATETPKPT